MSFPSAADGYPQLAEGEFSSKRSAHESELPHPRQLDNRCRISAEKFLFRHNRLHPSSVIWSEEEQRGVPIHVFPSCFTKDERPPDHRRSFVILMLFALSDLQSRFHLAHRGERGKVNVAGVARAEDHAAALDARHHARRKVRDHDNGLADEVLRLIPVLDA